MAALGPEADTACQCRIVGLLNLKCVSRPLASPVLSCAPPVYAWVGSRRRERAHLAIEIFCIWDRQQQRGQAGQAGQASKNRCQLPAASSSPAPTPTPTCARRNAEMMMSFSYRICYWLPGWHCVYATLSSTNSKLSACNAFILL